jgi:hypothetical protein
MHFGYRVWLFLKIYFLKKIKKNQIKTGKVEKADRGIKQ